MPREPWRVAYRPVLRFDLEANCRRRGESAALVRRAVGDFQSACDGRLKRHPALGCTPLAQAARS
jgi:hypothetical protein